MSYGSCSSARPQISLEEIHATVNRIAQVMKATKTSKEDKNSIIDRMIRHLSSFSIDGNIYAGIDGRNDPNPTNYGVRLFMRLNSTHNNNSQRNNIYHLQWFAGLDNGAILRVATPKDTVMPANVEGFGGGSVSQGSVAQVVNASHSNHNNPVGAVNPLATGPQATNPYETLNNQYSPTDPPSSSFSGNCPPSYY